ncbi:NADP-dependent oxidoreductase [Piscinibacter sakaiensis]|uniref:Putative oxidoreductase YncB n=1 Tax=Piscinibacter sakaiensis TaxID=1547922 RepID=A0A0K8P0B8_PISS1|nr:NADP-dependent oxidoreductase [Piscinibacter sakaiensis]GAP35615.1 putative oxidoreductase YncB [Piscinibacter sakaiensis]
MTDLTTAVNTRVRLAARPVGLPKPEDWLIDEVPAPAVPPDGVVVELLVLSLDPAMRGWMNEGRSYIEPVALGDVMRAGGIGRVIASNASAWPVGTLLSGAFGVQRLAAVDGRTLARGVTRVDLQLGSLTQWLNVLGMPGMTAYFGLLDVGQPQPGETVVVSGAAGAVGQTVGQLARIKGCRAVGIAGGEAKCRFVVEELGFDACIDYKAAAPDGAARWDPVREGLRQHCPDGIDVYFDNVGGDILDTVLTRIRRRARIVVCGAISQYNATGPVRGPANYLSLLVNRARMEGMVVFDYADRYGVAVGELAGHLASGRLKSREDVVEGLRSFPDALLKLFSGENFGKLVLQVSPP